MDPRFRRTSRRAEDVSVLGAILTWNLSVGSRACCPFHAYLAEGHKALSRLRGLRCKPQFRPQWTALCEECGLFATWVDVSAQADHDSGLVCSGCGQPSVKRSRFRSSL